MKYAASIIVMSAVAAIFGSSVGQFVSSVLAHLTNAIGSH